MVLHILITFSLYNKWVDTKYQNQWWRTFLKFKFMSQ
jgi:hypothetical protein